MFITTPASKYTIFVPVVEQYKWFHARGSYVGSSIIPFFFPFFFFYCSTYCFLLLPAELSVSHSLSAPVFAFLLCPTFCLLPVEPQVQMFRSVHSASWCCATSPAGQQKAPAVPDQLPPDTKASHTNTLCWPTPSGPARPHVAGWAGRRSDCWNGVGGVKIGVKTVKVIQQPLCIIVWHYQQCSAEGLPQMPTSGHSGSVFLPLPPCGESVPVHPVTHTWNKQIHCLVALAFIAVESHEWHEK